MTFHAEADNLVRLEAKIERTPRWLTLNLDLGEGDFKPGDVIGLVADIEGDADGSLEVFIRSNTDSGDTDTHFAERLPLSAGREIATALHTVAPGDGIVRSDSFHMLIMRLPKHDFRLNFRDMRLFVLPVAAGVRAPAMTLANAAP